MVNDYSVKEKNRIAYIDCIKGLNMMLVVLGHAINSGEVPICRTIWSFHMPLFFFTSGMLYYEKDMTQIAFFPYVRRKGYTLLVPQCTLAVLTVVSNIFISCILVKTCSITQIDYISPFLDWFLPTLFGMEILCWIKYRFVNKKWLNIVLLMEVCVFCVCSYTEVKFVQQILGALVFGDLGYLSRLTIERYYKSNRFENDRTVIDVRGGGDWHNVDYFKFNTCFV